MAYGLEKISPELVRKYQEEIERRSSKATAKRKMSSLKRFFDWAEQKGYLEEHPLKEEKTFTPIGIQPPPPEVQPGEPQEEKKPLTRFITPANALRAGALAALVVLVFLLVGRVQIPIPWRRAPASEEGVPGQTPTTDTGSKQPTILSPWTIHARMNLQKVGGGTVSGTQTIGFKLYKTPDGNTPLHNFGEKQVTVNEEGDTLILLDGVPTELFFENEELYLAAEIGESELDKRLPVSTANVASNLQGYYPEEEAGPKSIPVLSDDGSLLLSSEAPSVRTTNGNLLVEGNTLTLSTPTASDGDITINPDGSGIAHFVFEGTGQNYLNAQAPNLTSGSLYYGVVANGATGYDLLKLESGSSPVERFSVDAEGDTFIGGSLNVEGDIATDNTIRITKSGQLQNITGYKQDSGNFSITQGAGDTATIKKEASALSDLATLTLEEKGVPNSIYSTLVLKRINGAKEAMALYVDEGNATFDGQVRLGRFSSNPSDSIGTGSLIYNSSNNKVYYWNGTTWTEVGSGASTSFTNITSGTNTTAAMVVGSGASLDYTGTGTINASSLESLTSSQFLRSDTSDSFTSGTLTINTGTTFNVDGDVTIADTDISFDGVSTTFTTTGDLTINSGGGDVILSNTDTINIGGSGSEVAYNVIGDTTTGASANVDSDDDLYIEGNLEVDGFYYGDGSNLTNVDAETLDTFDSSQFLRSDTSDAFTSGTLTINTGTTFNVDGDLTIADTDISFDGASTTFTTTGALTIDTGSTNTINIATDDDILPSGTTGTNDIGSSGVPFDNIYAVSFDQNGNTVCDSSGNCPDSGPWDETSGVVHLDTTSNLVSIGDSTTEHKLEVEGAVTGKALVSLWEKGNQDILVASNSAVTPSNVFRLTNDGQVVLPTQGSTGGLVIGGDTTLYRSASNVLTTDDTLNAATALQTGGTFEALRNFPVPQRFFITSANDPNVPVLYVDSNGQITMNAQGSQAVRLNFDKGTGGIVFGDGAGAQAAILNSSGQLGLRTDSPVGKLDVKGAITGKALVILDETGDQNILTASASGTTVLNLDRSGNLSADGVFSFGDSTPDGNAYNTIGTGDATSGNINDSDDLFITDSLEVGGNICFGTDCQTSWDSAGRWTLNTTPTPDVLHPDTTTWDIALGGTDSSAPLFFDVSTGNQTLTGDIDIEGGDINPDADNELSLYINAAPGENPYLYIYGYDSGAAATRYGRLAINSTGTFTIEPQSGESLDLNSQSTADTFINFDGNANIRLFSGADSAETPQLRTFGYITAVTGTKYGYISVEDTNDTFQLGTQDSNLTGISFAPSGTTQFTIENSGDLTWDAATPTVSFTDGETVAFSDGTTNLVSIKDQDSYPFFNLAGKSTTGDPVSCAEGDIYYNAFDDTVSICHSGSTWEQLDGGGSSSVWSDLTDPSADLTLNHAEYETLFNWDTATDAALDSFTFNITNDLATDTSTQRAVVIENADDAGSTGTQDNLLVLDNLDTNEAVTTALQILSSGGGAITTAIDISDSDIDTALSAGANDLSGTNWSITGASGNFTSSGVLDINGGGTSDIAGTLRLSGNSLTSTGDLNINSGDGQVTFTDGDTINIGGLTGVTYNAFANGTDSPEEAAIASDNDVYVGGDLEVDGTIYGSGSGSIGGFTEGSVIFADSSGNLTEDNTNFFFNDTDDKLGLGVNTPDAKLQVTGAVTGIALAIFDETGDQNILTASASGQPRVSIQTDGDLEFHQASTILTSAGDLTLDSTGGSVILNTDDDLIPTLGAGDADIGASGTRWDNIYAVAGDFSGTVTANDFSCTNCLDFAEFEDTLDLDAALTLNQTTNTWSQSYTGTTGTGFSYTANSLTTGSALDITTSSNPAAAGPISPIQLNITNANATTATTINGLDIGFTNNPTIAGNTEYVAQIQNEATANTTDNALASLLRLDNADTNTSGSTVVTDALLVTVSGSLTSGIVDAIDASDANIDNALNIGANNLVGTTGNIDLTNFDVVGSSGNITTAGDLAVNGGNITTTQTTLNIDVADTGTIQFRDGTNTLAAIKDQDGYPFWNLAGKSTSGDPVSCAEGDIYYNAADDTISICHASSTWEQLDGGGAGGVWTHINHAVYPNDYWADDVLVGGNATASATFRIAASGNLDTSNNTIDWTLNNAVDALNIDSNTLSIDASNNRVGIGITTPVAPLTVNNSTAGILSVGDTNTRFGAQVSGDDSGIGLFGSNLYVDGSNNLKTFGTHGSYGYTGIEASWGDLYFYAESGATTQDATVTPTAKMVILDSGNVGIANSGPTTQLHIGTNSETHGLSTWDVLISSDLELDGVLYLDGGTIANLDGTGTVLFSGTPTTTSNTLTLTNWLIENPSAGGNVGQAALIVNNQHSGELFTASASGVTKFTIENDGDVTFGDASGTDLTVGGGSGKIDVGTVDPVYNIGGTKYATYMAGMVGVKEEVAGIAKTSTYVPGSGYKATIDFVNQEKGSDLWLFSKATDLAKHMEELVVLLSSSGNNNAWYRINPENYTLSIYTSRPTSVSYRLTAPRFDADLWTNYNDNENSVGFVLEDQPLTVTQGGDINEAEENYLAGVEIKESTASAESGNFFDSVTLPTFDITDKAGNVIHKIDTISKFVAANIKAGAIETRYLAVKGSAYIGESIKAGAVETGEITADNFIAFQGQVDNLLIKSGLVTPYLETETISPIADSDIRVNLDNSESKDGSSFGEFVIEGENDEDVASIDAKGNATFSGQVESESTKTEELRAGKIYADEIVARRGAFADLKAATSSAVTREEIENLLKTVEEDQKFLAESSSWSSSVATDSANLDEIAISDLYVTNQAAINSLSVSETVVVGNDFSIQTTKDEFGNLAATSINSLSAPLQIQSLASAPLEIMAGLVRIDTNGDVSIEGNLYVAGRIDSSGLTLKEKESEDIENSDFSELLSLENKEGKKVASIDASGSAQFSTLRTDKLVVAGFETTADSSSISEGEIASNATVGEAYIPAQTTEITIRNDKVTDYSLVYVTPTSSTLNNVLYVKAKGEGYFVVGFNDPVGQDVSFNWWVVDTNY